MATVDAAALGLTHDEARARRRQYGPNVIVPERSGARWWRVLLKSLTDPMTVLLLVAAPTYFALGETVDATVAVVALIPITATTVLLERRAERALEELQQRAAPTARVWRDGSLVHLPARDLVPGDAIEIHEGDVVPADGRVVESTQLLIDESALTGESEAVTKGPQAEVAAGTVVLSGRSRAEVTVTGRDTKYGAVAALVASVKQPPTPLERATRRLVLLLAVGALFFCVAVGAVELARGHGWGEAVIAGVSLGIATVPEEFPLVFTIYLGLGARQLALQRTLVRRLGAVETLGSTTVICTDKTGTLTLGTLAVATVEPIGEVSERVLLEAAVLACEPAPFDPLDLAICALARERDIDVEALHARAFVRDHPFDHADQYLTHVWQGSEDLMVAAKGSPEGLVRHTGDGDDRTRQVLDGATRLADAGLRVVAVASGRVPSEARTRADDETNLTVIGLVGFNDPLREGVRDALAQCRAAGIRVVMITGDHPVTAHAVAHGLDLPHGDDRMATGADIDAADDDQLADLVQTVNVFSRTRPEQKHRLVGAFRADGQVVAMTGDGINDAPALREADIGVVLGEHGTEVAREAADLVLLDDDFATIVRAVRNGRRIGENLAHAFAYLIAFHVPLLLGALLIPLLNRPLFLLPIQLVLLQLFIHPVVAIVFEQDRAAPGVMARPPRPATAMLAWRTLVRPAVLGLAFSVVVLGSYLLELHRGSTPGAARGFAFAVLVFGELGLVLVTRAAPKPFWRVGLRGNRVMIPILVGVALLMAFAFSVPSLRSVLAVDALDLQQWLTALALGSFGALVPDAVARGFGR
ncbi:MAG: cation-translocating P-type ATPase [Acidimicrobiia bacterium]